MYLIDSSVYQKIIKTIGVASIECGGIIGIKKGVICAYYFDRKGKGYEAAYIPNTKVLNKIIEKWKNKGISFIGVIHNHLNSYDKPSFDDKVYAQNILECNMLLNKVLFPIVTQNGNSVKITLYEYTDDFYLRHYKLI